MLASALDTSARVFEHARTRDASDEYHADVALNLGLIAHNLWLIAHNLWLIALNLGAHR